MSTYNIITAICFISSIALEAFLDARENLGLYEKKDTRANIILAVIGVIVNLIAKGLIFSLFLLVEPLAVFDAGRDVLSWIVLFLLTDLHFYLFHWLGHKSRFFWAMHVIHHSSPRYNLTTAIRTPFTNCFFRIASFTPFILIGFDPIMVVIMDSLLISFTFYQHTEMVKKLGWLEYVLSTPSHHRVHHASDEKYLDKNFGGVLIIWDKLFGTFKEEEEHPTYGLTKPLDSNNVVRIIFHEWIAMAHDVRYARNLKEVFGYIFLYPGWKPGVKSAKGRQTFLFPSVKNAAIIAFLIGLSYSFINAQSPTDLLKEGLVAEESHNDQLAYQYYSQILALNPNHTEALWRASRILSNQSGRSSLKADKTRFAQQADELAVKSIKLNPGCKEAHLAHIVALGLLSEVASSPAEKLQHAKTIKAEAETIVQLDSLYAPAYYVLGKWHLEIAKLNWAEKLACNVLFGGVPKGASYEKSIQYFERAITLQPGYILFHYGKASALYHSGKYDLAIAVLEKALRLPHTEPDDQVRQKKCQNLLKETRQLYTKA
jgi:sterol desaturase/sphingolipid hydroxylase (fatty acid hydroxylase superfamily)